MNALVGMLNNKSNLKTEGHIDEDIQTEQASKDKKTVEQCVFKKKHKKKQTDITADRNNKRVRSHRSRTESKDPDPGNSKGDSRKDPKKKDEISNNVRITEPLLRKVVQSKLGNYQNNKDTYGNGLIRIISESEFLIACYMLIKGNPGNMTKGIDNATLDGINLD